MVKGIIINKFRGDTAILEPGLRQLEDMTKVPVLGVIPYTEIYIPSEDSVSIDDKIKMSGNRDHPIDIAVLRLPRISNFTDFEPLEPYANIRYVELGSDPGYPDALIIPGTKNTIDDLKVLRMHGMDSKIHELAKAKVPIIGICGGYQMLGKTITDSGIEGSDGNAVSISGLGLLGISTDFSKYEKQTVQVKKTVTGTGPILGRITGQQVSGYEIHMGLTNLGEGAHAFDDDGCTDRTGLIWGTYLHGLFENENLRDAFLEYLYTRRGLSYSTVRNNVIYQDPYHQLAEHFLDHVDMDAIDEMVRK